ncbi:hemerythrin domain-containing protein [Streptomyces sp. NPDC048521]|uniref:hemerythrin domain-containing protein n=1 Tax=Streptomyces sp. NPDC048521 TaxID=3365566 RepID=UPI0037210E79
MSATQVPAKEGTRLFEELCAVHGIMTRGAQLVAGSFTRLAGGAAVDTRTLVTTLQWFVELVRHVHRRKDELLWPVLRERFPVRVRRLDRSAEDADALDEALDALESVIERIAEERRVGGSVSWGHAMREGTLASHRVRDLLAERLGVEEPLLKGLLHVAPDEDVVGLRKALADSVPRGGPHLVLGLLEHPEPLRGRDHVYAGLPPSVRWTRWMLVSRFRRTLKALAAG